jgi:hypothetical protein
MLNKQDESIRMSILSTDRGIQVGHGYRGMIGSTDFMGWISDNLWVEHGRGTAPWISDGYPSDM